MAVDKYKNLVTIWCAVSNAGISYAGACITISYHDKATFQIV